MTGILARLPRPRRLALLLGGSALAAVAYFGLGGERVEVARVERGELRQAVVASGRVRTPQRVEVASQITGRVTGVAVREGDAVTAGQVLLQFDAAEWQARKDAWQPPELINQTPWQELYRRNVGQLAVHHECIFRQIDDRFGDHLAVTVLRREREGNLLARLFAQDRLLEFGEQHACSADELEGSARLGLVCDCAVNGQFVIDRYHFVFFYFHCFQKII